MNVNRYYVSTLLILIIYSTRIFALEPRDIVILILSQENSYNSKIAHNLEQNIIQQSKEINQVPPLVYLSHRDFPHVGDWTILPLLPRLAAAHKTKAAWLFICNEHAQINLIRLNDVLSNHNETEDTWLGYALYDRDVTIIHHFAFYEDPTSFLYPNIASGFAVSIPLLIKTADRFATQQYENSDNDLEFSIDASHELALFIWEKDKGVALVHEPNFCISKKDQEQCATYVTPFTSCGKAVPNDSIYFAVKTCSKYHKDRVNAVQKTWAEYTENIYYFSDVEDSEIPTIFLNIPNTEYGHCAKTFAIIKHAYNELKRNKKIKWVVITDDDTIIRYLFGENQLTIVEIEYTVCPSVSPSRLRNLLSCYENRDDFLALGERYGYRVQNLDQTGYNYITGGGGTVLSSSLVEKIIETTEMCNCPKIDSPDDMFLGVCLARIGVKLTHSPQFHQARPNDYAPEYLHEKEAISFHKHWMIKPEEVYQHWFEESDKILFDSTNVNAKTEL